MIAMGITIGSFSWALLTMAGVSAILNNTILALFRPEGYWSCLSYLSWPDPLAHPKLNLKPANITLRLKILT
jgi:hypothetical protein